jgi:hypothetical protein
LGLFALFASCGLCGVDSKRFGVVFRRVLVLRFSFLLGAVMTEASNPSELTQQMFAAVGRAITQWSFVEESLCRVFSVCVGTAIPLKDHDGVEFIEAWTSMWLFYAAESFNAKRSLVNAAVTAHVHQVPQRDELVAEWAKLSDKARTLSGKRNKLAHWTVIPAQRRGTGAGHEPIAPARLMPPFGSPKYWRETGLNPLGQSLTAVQVGHIEKAFRLYAEKVRSFTLKLVRTQELLDKDAFQAMRLLTLDRRLSSSALEELEHALASRE